ncbi:hypothetical protein ACROYT_G028836 [Oculina patagonica]
MAPKDPVHAVIDDEEVVSSASAALEFGDANLKAIAEVYNSEGDDEFRKQEYGSAIHFYTEGIKVNCNNKELNAKLHSNRATAHNCLGNYHEALTDAKAAKEFKPSCLKAFSTGARACVNLNLFEKAIAWIDDGLKIDLENQTLLELKKESITKQCELFEINGKKMKSVQTKMDKEGDYQSPMTFTPLNLDIAKKVGNRKKVGLQYLKLGNGFLEISRFQKAIDNYQQYLRVCKEQEDKKREGHAYGKLGNAYNSIGKIKEAMKYYEPQLRTAKEVGDRSEEGRALSNLGNVFYCLGDFEKAREYHKLHLKIAIDLGDSSGEGYAYGNLGNTFHMLGLCEKAMKYHDLHLQIVKELDDRVGEEKAYGNLGRVLRSLGDIEYHELQRSIAQEEGLMADQACAYYELGCSVESQGSELEALEHYKSSARLFEGIRVGLPCKQNNYFRDEWKINLFDLYQCVYTALCRMYPSRLPREEDYLLTMAEVFNVEVRARLVVLSCCHSGRGDVKAEGVVCIARAFLAAGARSVLASLWAIEDEATLEFMNSFYQHLVEGNKASEALNKAMKRLRESERFGQYTDWAPFVLIGDDVTLEFLHKPCTMAEANNVEERAPDNQ